MLDIAANHSKQVIAIPLNTTLGTKLTDVWDLLRNTRMHELDLQEAEFSLSVSIKSYPSNIFSVWIYIACFKDRDDIGGNMNWLADYTCKRK